MGLLILSAGLEFVASLLVLFFLIEKLGAEGTKESLSEKTKRLIESDRARCRAGVYSVRYTH